MSTSEPEPQFVGPEHPDAVIGVNFVGLRIADRGSYDVHIDVAEVFGLLDCVRLAVQAPSGRRVDGELIRKIRISDLVRKAAAKLDEGPPALAQLIENHLAGRGRPGGMFDTPRELLSDEDKARRDWYEREISAPHDAAAERWKAARIREAARAGGRLRLEAAAEIYKRAQGRGRPPTKAVAEELRVSYGAAVGIVRRCRETDPPLLPKTSQGKAAGVEATGRRTK